MRHADDISDDSCDSGPIERRSNLNEWLDAYHRVVGGEPTDDPVFMALAPLSETLQHPDSNCSTSS